MSEPKWITAARAELGVREISGPKSSPRVLDYFKASGHGYVVEDETAWCSAFANFCMAEAGIKGSMSLAARSWLNWGHKVQPQPGCVMVFKRGTSSWQGHVAFYVGETDTHYKCLGGNQGNKVSIAIYRKDVFLGARMPATMGTSYKAKAGALGLGSFLAAQAEAVVPYVEQAAGLPGLQGYTDWLGMAALTLSAAAFGYMLWREWKDVSSDRVTPEQEDEE